MQGIKILLFLFLFPPMVSGQDFRRIEVESSIGVIILNENYIHCENLPIQRIELVHIGEKSNIFCWKWKSDSCEYYFSHLYDKMWFVKIDSKTGRMLNRYKIYHYRYETK